MTDPGLRRSIEEKYSQLIGMKKYLRTILWIHATASRKFVVIAGITAEIGRTRAWNTGRVLAIAECVNP
jgi:hypothetical protein